VIEKRSDAKISETIVETLRSTENSGNRFVTFDKKLEFGPSGREKSLIQNVQQSCIQESFGGNYAVKVLPGFALPG
jgi:hypothetical protein